MSLTTERRELCSQCGSRIYGTECPRCGPSAQPHPMMTGETATEQAEHTDTPDERDALPEIAAYDFSAQAGNPIGIVGGAIGAVVGALIWAGILAVTRFEIGWAAWGIGGLVGLGTLLMGGRGHGMGIAAAILTLASIFAGKLVGAHFILTDVLEEIRTESFNRAAYDEMQRDADGYTALGDYPSEEETRTFMVEHGFTESNDPALVPDTEVSAFEDYSAPVLRSFAEEQPSFQMWQDTSFAAFRSSLGEEVSLMGAVIDELNFIDLIFAFLGVSTAYGMIIRRSNAMSA